jgi:hypothetical protein
MVNVEGTVMEAIIADERAQRDRPAADGTLALRFVLL